VTAPISESGRVLGTVPYMAPSRSAARPVDARTDLFALGILLYELASGSVRSAARPRPTPLRDPARRPEPLASDLPATSCAS
jgi:serine/threonine-protein kinase